MYLRNAAVSGWNLAMISLRCFSGYLVSGDSSEAMWRRTASFLWSFTGMLIKVPSGRKNWSICSVIRVIINPDGGVNRKFM